MGWAYSSAPPPEPHSLLPIPYSLPQMLFFALQNQLYISSRTFVLTRRRRRPRIPQLSMPPWWKTNNNKRRSPNGHQSSHRSQSPRCPATEPSPHSSPAQHAPFVIQHRFAKQSQSRPRRRDPFCQTNPIQISARPPGTKGAGPNAPARRVRPACPVCEILESAVQTLAQKLDSIAHYWYPMLAEALRSCQIEIERVGGGVE